MAASEEGGSFRNEGVPSFGVLIIRILQFWVLYERIWKLPVVVKGARHSRPPGPNAIVLPQNLAKYSRLDSIIV